MRFFVGPDNIKILVMNGNDVRNSVKDILPVMLYLINGFFRFLENRYLTLQRPEQE